MQHRGGNTCSATGSSRIYGATAVIGVTPRVRPPRDPGSHCCLAVNRTVDGAQPRLFAVVQPTRFHGNTGCHQRGKLFAVQSISMAPHR